MIVVGAAVAAAVLVLRPPTRRAVPSAPELAAVDDGVPARALSAVLLDAAAQLAAGADASVAWQRVLRTPVPSGAPSIDQLLARVAQVPRTGPLARVRRGSRARQSERAAAASVVVAVTAAGELGAPLVDVLQRLAAALFAEEESAADVRAAVAGPRATGRVLAWLPLLGLAVAMLLGAHPVEVMLGGGLGTAAAALGIGLLLVGRVWTRRLLARVSGGRP